MSRVYKKLVQSYSELKNQHALLKTCKHATFFKAFVTLL